MLPMKMIREIERLPLVENRPILGHSPIFVTISPNPMTKHSITKVNRVHKIPYKMLPQKLQYEYCLRLVHQVYNYSTSTRIYGSAELNESGNIHFHFIFDDPNIRNKVDIAMLQRDVLNCPSVILNLSKGKNPRDYMNNICFINKPINEIYDYIHKDIKETIRHFPIYTNFDILNF